MTWMAARIMADELRVVGGSILRAGEGSLARRVIQFSIVWSQFVVVVVVVVVVVLC